VVAGSKYDRRATQNSSTMPRLTSILACPPFNLPTSNKAIATGSLYDLCLTRHCTGWRLFTTIHSNRRRASIPLSGHIANTISHKNWGKINGGHSRG